MQAYILDFINFMLRWLHVIAAIAWIGESIYFVMLDNGLKAPRDEACRKKGVAGEMWAVHGGGFYHNQKYATSPAALPDDLHWSFWKAYTTWLSGFTLFVILYMVNPSVYLINPNSSWEWAANMTSWQANGVALLFLLSGWLIYNELCKRISPNMERDGILSAAVAVLMVAVAYTSTQLFAGRAAFLLTGAVMATAMSANVFFWIIPGQRRMVNAMKAGQTPDPLDGKRGKQRSVHNTYFTLPVVLLMVSNHYAFAYTYDHAWVIMSLFILAGALIRQFFVLMHAGKTLPAFPAAGVALIFLAFWMAAPAHKSDSDSDSAPDLATDTGMAINTPNHNVTDSTAVVGTAVPVTAPDARTTTDAPTGPATENVEAVINLRCQACHSQEPTQPGFSAPPAGLAFDNLTEIMRYKNKIQEVVSSQYMPLGNITKMTDKERDVIAAWQE